MEETAVGVRELCTTPVGVAEEATAVGERVIVGARELCTPPVVGTVVVPTQTVGEAGEGADVWVGEAVMAELGPEGDVGGVVKRCVGTTVAGWSAGAAADGLPVVGTEEVNVGAWVTEVEAVGGRDGASMSPGAVGVRVLGGAVGDVLGERCDGGV
jgi:hypothetical protein